MKHNFNSGPAVLPPEVLEEAKAGIDNFRDSGVSVLSIPHRSSWFVEVMEDSRRMVRQLMQLNDDYDVLFLHCGATMQFIQFPYNFLPSQGKAAYCFNGVWGKKAINEAKAFGQVNIACSSEDKNHNYLRKKLAIDGDEAYLHLTTNNTIEGTQWHEIPSVAIPMVADMTSDIFSRQLPFDKFSFIYAGAQKNLGIAGVTLVVIKKGSLVEADRYVPSLLSYNKHIDANSILNTPPVFAVYCSWLMLKWIIAQGGLAEMERRALERSTLLYASLDELELYNKPVAIEDRSLMNAVFTISDPKVEKLFLQECELNGFVGVKGHRSVGGLRVSMYNALPLESVKVLCQFLKWFQEKHG